MYSDRTADFALPNIMVQDGRQALKSGDELSIRGRAQVLYNLDDCSCVYASIYL